MELFNYYSIDECTDRNFIKKKLKKLLNEGKIEFEIDGDILKLTDIDLELDEIKDLIKIFDKFDVFPYPDYTEDIDNDDDLYGYDEDDYDY